MARPRSATAECETGTMQALSNSTPSPLVEHLGENFWHKWKYWVGVDQCQRAEETGMLHGLPLLENVCWRPASVELADLNRSHRHAAATEATSSCAPRSSSPDDFNCSSTRPTGPVPIKGAETAAAASTATPPPSIAVYDDDSRLRRERRIAGDFVLLQRLKAVVQTMMDHRTNHGDFNKHIELFDSEEYRAVVDRPLHLATIKEQLYKGDVYETVNSLDRDMKLVFQNALTFNPPSSYVHRNARKLLAVYEEVLDKSLSQWREGLKKSFLHRCDNCHGSACACCGYKCLEFKRVELVCSSPIAHLPNRTGGCGRRISPNSEYYRAKTNGQHWCTRCFKKLPEEFVDLSGALSTKQHAQRLVHNNVCTEKWLRCTVCSRSFHRICVGETYDVPPPNAVTEVKSTFTCSLCSHAANPMGSPVSIFGKASSSTSSSKYLFAADSFAECTTSRFMMQQIRTHVLRAFDAGKSTLRTRESVEDFLSTLTVRVTSRVPSVSSATPRLRRWIKCLDENAPTQFPFTSKAVSLFQRIDGVDVLLFVIYLQEYGPDSPGPNSRCAYIAYLDSINTLTPRALRSTVYQQMVSSYITWAKLNGFRRVYIWSCPPTKNQNYALHCHPPSQRTPDSSRLRRWYGMIIKDLTMEGVVLRSTTLHDAHFSEHKPFVATRRNRGMAGKGPARRNSFCGSANTLSGEGGRPRCNSEGSRLPQSADRQTKTIDVPLFYGDFWPSQAEIVIREYLECPTGRNTGVVDQSPAMRRWWQRVLRDTGEADFILSAAASTTADTVVLVDDDEPPSASERLSWLMSRVATRVAAMNKYFMVLDLCIECSLCGRGGQGHPTAAATEHWVCSNRSCRYTLCGGCFDKCGGVAKHAQKPAKSPRSPRVPAVFLPSTSTLPSNFKPCLCDSHRTGKHRFVLEQVPIQHFEMFDNFVLEKTPSTPTRRGKRVAATASADVVAMHAPSTPDDIAPFPFPSHGGVAKNDVTTSRKRKLPTLPERSTKVPRRLPPALQSSVLQHPRSVAALGPPDEPTLNTVFDNRLTFLWFCQKHHLQFDQLRRAKFSTQMILRNLGARVLQTTTPPSLTPH